MERFDYNPRSIVAVPDIPGLTILEIGLDRIGAIRTMNRVIFKEERIINTFEREDLLILEARIDGDPVGFKIGYRESRHTFYSAKGGVMQGFRRRGIAVALLSEMMRIVAERGYRRLAFDTFPNLHPGMTILALDQGFLLTKSDFNSAYREYRLRFEKRLDATYG